MPSEITKSIVLKKKYGVVTALGVSDTKGLITKTRYFLRLKKVRIIISGPDLHFTKRKSNRVL